MVRQDLKNAIHNFVLVEQFTVASATTCVKRTISYKLQVSCCKSVHKLWPVIIGTNLLAAVNNLQQTYGTTSNNIVRIATVLDVW